VWLKSGKQLNVTGLLYFDFTELLKYRVLNYDIIKSRLTFAALFEDHFCKGQGGQSGV
jgi:hypothetical protein